MSAIWKPKLHSINISEITNGKSCAIRFLGKTFGYKKTTLRSYALDPIFYFLIKLLKLLNIFIGCFPITASVHFQQRSNNAPEAMRVQLQQTLPHLRIIDEGVIGFLVNEVVNSATGCTPTESEVETLGHLSNALVTGIKHAFVPLGIQELGP